MLLISVVADGVGVADQIEPETRKPFTEVRIFQQSIDLTLVLRLRP